MKAWVCENQSVQTIGSEKTAHAFPDISRAS